MPNLEQIQTWIDGYVRAWNSNQPAAIGQLFAEDAAYYTAPYSSPWRGRDGIVANWLARKDEPGQTRFTWRPLVIGEDLAVIHGETIYMTPPPRSYSNLWLIRLDASSRCTEFTEWWMEHPAVHTRSDGGSD
jgi:uncharacterized protein (TIGR02246 family)